MISKMFIGKIVKKRMLSALSEANPWPIFSKVDTKIVKKRKLSALSEANP